MKRVELLNEIRLFSPRINTRSQLHEELPCEKLLHFASRMADQSQGWKEKCGLFRRRPIT